MKLDNFSGFCNWVSLHFGITVQKHQYNLLKVSLEIIGKKHGISTLSELTQRLSTGECEDQSLYYDIIQAVTVEESYFFRTLPQIRFLKEQYLPRLIESRRASGSRFLRIWSAGSAGGQEPYTIAMLLNELLPDIDEWSIYLIGSDINQRALERARKGLYTQNSFRSSDMYFKNKYFKEVGGHFQLSDDIRKLVTFARINFHDDHYICDGIKLENIDLILCRNVFIYFDEKMVAHALSRLVKALTPGGVLMLAPSDIIQNHVDGILTKCHDEVIYYSKDSDILFSSPHLDTPAAFQQPVVVPQNLLSEDPILTEILPSYENADVEALFLEGDWEGVISHLDTLPADALDLKALQLQARAYTLIGAVDEAMASCEKAIECDDLNANNYLLQGLLLSSGADRKQAEKALRKAIFLDASLVEAHYHLGLVCLADGRQREGERCLRNAVNMIDADNSETPLFTMPSSTLGSLKEGILEMGLVGDDYARLA